MPRLLRYILFVAAGLALARPLPAGLSDAELKARDDLTFRPTVLVKKGKAQGSGTIIASADNVTLVLTAAHVVSDVGPLRVELHRYNLGLEKSDTGGPWPKEIPARVVARDVSGDVAILRIDGLNKFPYVARLADLDDLPPQGTAVTSIGIDLGTDFKSWDTQIKGIAQLTRDEKDPRLFLLTEHAPEHGRSGGGLFLDDGRLLGVCVGRIEERGANAGRVTGLFASGPTIRRVLRQVARGN